MSARVRVPATLVHHGRGVTWGSPFGGRFGSGTYASQRGRPSRPLGSEDVCRPETCVTRAAPSGASPSGNGPNTTTSGCTRCAFHAAVRCSEMERSPPGNACGHMWISEPLHWGVRPGKKSSASCALSFTEKPGKCKVLYSDSRRVAAGAGAGGRICEGRQAALGRDRRPERASRTRALSGFLQAAS